MPLIIYMKNGIQFPVKGEAISPREWRGERMVSKTTQAAQGGRIARPSMVIPGGRRS